MLVFIILDIKILYFYPKNRLNGIIKKLVQLKSLKYINLTLASVDTSNINTLILGYIMFKMLYLVLSLVLNII